MSGFAEYLDPGSVRELAFSILKKEGRSCDGKNWTVRDLCILFDWMKEHIRYEYDDDLYNQSHYVATPTLTLKNGAGDCEDHALLWGSLCMAIGANVRIVYFPMKHIATEILLGTASSLDMSQIDREVERYLNDKSASLGLPKDKYIFESGKHPGGWIKGSNGQWEKSGSGYRHYSRNKTPIRWFETREGLVYLPADVLFCNYLGDLKSMKKYQSKGGSGFWESVEYHYPEVRSDEPVPQPSQRPLPRPQRRKTGPLPTPTPIPTPPRRRYRPRLPRRRVLRSPPKWGNLFLLLFLCAAGAWASGSHKWGVDIGAGLLVGWFALRGWFRGAFDQVGKVAIWAVPMAVAFFFVDSVEARVADHWPFSARYRTEVVALTIFVLARWISRPILNRFVDGRSNGIIDAFGGLVLGAGKGVLAFALLLLLYEKGDHKVDWKLPKDSQAVEWVYKQAWFGRLR